MVEGASHSFFFKNSVYEGFDVWKITRKIMQGNCFFSNRGEKGIYEVKYETYISQ